MASSTFPPQVSCVLPGIRGFCGLQPWTVAVPPVLPAELELVDVLPPLPPHAAASSATAETPATVATVRVIPRMDVLLLGSAVQVNGRFGLLAGGGGQPCNA